MTFVYASSVILSCDGLRWRFWLNTQCALQQNINCHSHAPLFKQLRLELPLICLEMSLHRRCSHFPVR